MGSDYKQTEPIVQEVCKYAESIVETVHEPLVVLDANLRVISANRSFYQTFKVTAEETERQLIYRLGNHQWDIPKLRELLEDILPKKTTFDDFEVECRFPNIGRRIMLLNACRLYREADNTQAILIAIEDITERRRAKEALRGYREHLEELVKERTAEIRTANEASRRKNKAVSRGMEGNF